MKLSSRNLHRPVNLELTMTSLIDVVFLLLIFFLVTTTFTKPEMQLLPNIKVDDETAASESPMQIESVYVLPGSDGKGAYKIGSVITTDIDELEKILTGASDESKLDGVMVYVNPEAPFGKAVEAFNACRQSGFLIVSYVPENE